MQLSVFTFLSLVWIADCHQGSRISSLKCQEYKNLVPTEETAEMVCAPHEVRFRPRSQCFHLKKYHKCADFTGLIVGGQKTSPGEFPHMAALGWRKRNEVKFLCGGSLISEKFVLTVAHCTKKDKQNLKLVRLGDQNLAESDDGAEPVEYDIKETYDHHSHDSYLRHHDIALVELERNVRFTEFIRPACLHQAEQITSVVIATGWGKTAHNKEPSDDLLKVALNVTTNEFCLRKVGLDMNVDEILPTQVCAGGVMNRDTCKGDSGAPIQIPHDDIPCAYTIVGLTSYGNPRCGSKLPSIYTRVAPYLDWIEQKVWPNRPNGQKNCVSKNC